MASEVKVEVKLNLPGFTDLRRSEAVKAMLKRKADAIAAAAGDGFEVAEHDGATRSRAVVYAETAEAMVAEATGRDLTNAIDAGRA